MSNSESGRALAERHQRSNVDEFPEFEPAQSLLNYAERPARGGWSLRSSLVRLAQPHPVPVSDLLTESRRLDAILQPARSKLFRLLGPADRSIGLDSGTESLDDLYLDTRLADLGRLVGSIDPTEVSTCAHETLAGYERALAEGEITDLERQALPLFVVAAGFERLAATLDGWACVGHQDPPVEAVADVAAWSGQTLTALGVPVDAGSIPPGRSPRRSKG